MSRILPEKWMEFYDLYAWNYSTGRSFHNGFDHQKASKSGSGSEATATFNLPHHEAGWVEDDQIRQIKRKNVIYLMVVAQLFGENHSLVTQFWRQAVHHGTRAIYQTELRIMSPNPKWWWNIPQLRLGLVDNLVQGWVTGISMCLFGLQLQPPWPSIGGLNPYYREDLMIRLNFSEKLQIAKNKTSVHGYFLLWTISHPETMKDSNTCIETLMWGWCCAGLRRGGLTLSFQELHRSACRSISFWSMLLRWMRNKSPSCRRRGFEWRHLHLETKHGVCLGAR